MLYFHHVINLRSDNVKVYSLFYRYSSHAMKVVDSKDFKELLVIDI